MYHYLADGLALGSEGPCIPDNFRSRGDRAYGTGMGRQNECHVDTLLCLMLFSQSMQENGESFLL